MNILKQIAIKNLKLNKKRTISTIIGIVLSCSLICAVAAMCTSFQETLIQNAINESGYYHLKISNVTDEDVKTLKNNRDIESVKTIYEIGYGKLENCQNENKPYLNLYSMNKTLFDDLKFNLIEGRFPTNNNEVIISEHIINNGKVKYQIGDKINIDVGKRTTLDDMDILYKNPYNENDEKLVNTENYEFTIVGIIKRPDYSFESYSNPGYTIISTDINKENKRAYITLKKPKEYQKSISEILGAKDYEDLRRLKNLEELKYENFDINTELLRWEAFAFEDSTVTMIYTVAGVVIFIIIFTSIFCIRNSFAIATTEKMKMYGMLSSIGATKKQIKKNVISECLALGVVGIPLGIVSGIFAVYVLMAIVNQLLGKYLLGHVDGIIVKVSFEAIILTIILGTITIYLSALHSAKRASRVSPIEALKGSNDIKIKSKKLRVPKVISKIFKTGGELAYKNLKRSKKKYRTTVISLAVSIFIFITMNSFLVSAFGLTNNYYEDFDYNIKMYCDEDGIEDINKIKKLSNVDEYFILYENKDYIRIRDLSKINEISGLELSEEGFYDEEKDEFIPSGKGKYSGLQLIALDNETFRKYVKKIGVNYDKVKNKGILSDNYMNYDENGRQIDKRIYKYKKGDTITGDFKDKNISFEVGAITDIKPYGMEKTYYSGGYLILNLDEFKSMGFYPYIITIQTSNSEGLIQELKNANINIRYTDLGEAVKEEKAMSLVIKIFLYGFIAVITLIGVTNIFNTITSNMELRQTEFAMLKSIGMTKSEFNRMINLETIFYSVKALIYGIILGLIGTFAMYKAFSVKIQSRSIYTYKTYYNFNYSSIYFSIYNNEIFN